MAEDLPEEFDLIVIGTGFPESCVAAAASRVGKTVLHIDPNDFYGGAWASFGLEGLNALLASDNNNAELRNGCFEWHIPLEAPHQQGNCKSSVPASREITQLGLLEQSRRFNLDLCPKILFSAGNLVQLLVTSNICRYAEFRAVDRVCTRLNNKIQSVPCSRSDVFNTKELSIVEKRLLMKFLNICMTYGEEKSYEDMAEYHGKTFHEYLKAQKVTDKIKSCVIQAIAMCNEDTLFEEGMERTQRFLNSLGRYGNTPFLFPMYGCGEIPQCFCRLCAVFGGVYCLKRRIVDITIDTGSNQATVLIEEGRAIRAKHVVCSHGNVPKNLLSINVGTLDSNRVGCGLSRGIFIASTPLGSDELNSGGGGVNLLRLLAGSREAILIQLSHYSGTCPRGIYIFHITTPAVSDDPKKDLEQFMAQAFHTEHSHAPKLLYSAYFTLSACARPSSTTKALIYSTAAPYYELDYDLSIKNARDIFTRLYENDEFLPRAPDPEEIIIDGEDPRALNEVYLADDLREQLRQLEESAEQMDIDDAGNQDEVSHSNCDGSGADGGKLRRQ